MIKVNLIAKELRYQIILLFTSFIFHFFVVSEYSSVFIGYLSENEGFIYTHSSYTLDDIENVEKNIQYISFICLYLPVFLYILFYHLNYSLFNVLNLKFCLIQHYILVLISFYFDLSKNLIYDSLLNQNEQYSSNIILNSNISYIVYLFAFYQSAILLLAPLLYLIDKISIIRWFIFLLISLFWANWIKIFFIIEFTFFFLHFFKRWLSG